MTADDARARVARGAALLDEKKPGWAAKINIKKLSMEDCEWCALGQLFDYYRAGVLVLGWSICYSGTVAPDAPVATHGFTLDGSLVEIADPRWRLLRAAWVEAITDRLTPPATWTHREPRVSQKATS